jgi:hypothetical protein
MSAPVHEMTDNKRGWRCSCGEWLHSSNSGIIESCRSKHLARWNGLAESCWLTCWRLRPSRAEAARPLHPSTRKGTTVNQNLPERSEDVRRECTARRDRSHAGAATICAVIKPSRVPSARDRTSRGQSHPGSVTTFAVFTWRIHTLACDIRDSLTHHLRCAGEFCDQGSDRVASGRCRRDAPCRAGPPDPTRTGQGTHPHRCRRRDHRRVPADRDVHDGGHGESRTDRRNRLLRRRHPLPHPGRRLSHVPPVQPSR